MLFSTWMTVFAQGEPQQAPSWTMYVPMLIIGFMMIMFLRTSSKQKREMQQAMSNLKKNDKVVTIGGILGTVVSVSPPEMALAGADPPVPDPVVQGERGLVVGKDVELDLADADRPRPVLGALHQGITDAPPAVAVRDHEPDVGDVLAGRMAFPADGEAADDLAVELGDEHGGVPVPSDRLEVAPFLGDAAPASVGDQPAALLRPDGLRQAHERAGVARLSAADGRRHSTTAPAPPRLGSPAASSSPSSPSPTAEAPPK